MCRSRCLLFALLVAASPASSWGQGGAYWLIKEVKGRWEYRVGTGEARQLTGQYDAVYPAGQVRCLEADLDRCELRYLVDPRSIATERLDVRLEQSGRWVSLKGLTPPAPPVVPTTAAELVKKFTRVTRAGGSRSATACGGDLPLRAPACGENVDVDSLTVRWAPPSDDASKKYVVFVENVDGEAMRFRGNASASAGQFSDEGLHRFLRKVQAQNDPVALTVRVQGEGDKKAVRLVHVPPASVTGPYAARVQQAPRDNVSRIRTLMALALDEDMYSRAAEEATRLIPLAAGSPGLLELALAGLCQSDFEEEKALLRRRISARRYGEICSSGSAPLAAPAAPAPAAEAAAAPPDVVGGVETGASTRTRLGIALLVGNWDYWNVPLNSVKEDIRHMRETLETLGFVVHVKENLRSPRQFGAALDQALADASAEDVLLVYYSGHGVQLDGKSHLLSTGVSGAAQVAEDVRENAQSTEELLAQMERSLPSTRVLIVEACRDNVLSSGGTGGSQAARGGFAFQQDDVSNTFVMFANKPGQTTAARSSGGLMGPFTDALIFALQNSTGEILDVYDVAAAKAAEFSPGQEPVMYHSKVIEPVVLRRPDQTLQDNRARDLLDDAEALYRDRAWDQFQLTVNRGRVLATDPAVQHRLGQEAEFVDLVRAAEAADEDRRWADAAERWQKAATLFPARQWTAMRAASSFLLADDVLGALRCLAALGAQSDSNLSLKAKQLLASLVQAFPAMEPEAARAAQGVTRVSDVEFEKFQDEE